MSNFPHYRNGDIMKKEDLFLYNGEKLAILDNIIYNEQQNNYIIYFRMENDLIQVPFNLLEDSNIKLVKIEGDKPKKESRFVITFYFDNKETYSTEIGKEIAESIEDFSKYKINFKDIMYIISPEDNSISVINLDKVTHFEIEKID